MDSEINYILFTEEEARLLLSWFGYVQDLAHPHYLVTDDFILAKKLHDLIGSRVPNSITDRIPK